MVKNCFVSRITIILMLIKMIIVEKNKKKVYILIIYRRDGISFRQILG